MGTLENPWVAGLAGLVESANRERGGSIGRSGRWQANSSSKLFACLEGGRH